MRLRLLAFFLVLAGLLASPATAAGPGGAIMATVNGAIAAANADSAAGVNAYFTPSSSVVDEFAPYHWSGPSAAAAWWTALDRMDVATHTVHLHATVQTITQFHVTGNLAYVVVPMSITFTARGKPGHEMGLWALTMRRTGSTWRIATAAWATLK